MPNFKFIPGARHLMEAPCPPEWQEMLSSAVFVRVLLPEPITVGADETIEFDFDTGKHRVFKTPVEDDSNA